MRYWLPHPRPPCPLPDALELVGIDPARGMIKVANATSSLDTRIRCLTRFAEHLPFRDGICDLSVSTSSFDLWADQRAGLRECARVLARSGQLVLTDLFSTLLMPTLLVGHRGRAALFIKQTLGCSRCAHDRPHSHLESRVCRDAMCAAAMMRGGEPLARA